MKRIRWGVVAIASCGLASVPARSEGPAAVNAPVAAALEQFAEHEREDKGIPGLAIALVDDQQVVWSTALGWADLDKTEPLTTKSAIRIAASW